MRLAKYTGTRLIIHVGRHKVSHGQTVGEPGHEGQADVVACPGAIYYLLKRQDFVPEEVEEETED